MILKLKMRLRSFLGASLAALLVAAAALAHRPASAVEQTGDLTGTVRDEKSQPLPGATMTLKGENLLGERATVTDAKGEFWFRSLPPGRYTLKTAFVGYQTIEQDGITVNIGRATTLPISLTKGELSESVNVIGKTPVVDTVRTTTQDNYGPDYLSQVPIGSNGRDYLSVIAQSAGTGPGDGANPTVRGSTLGGNVYLVDGVDTTWGRHPLRTAAANGRPAAVRRLLAHGADPVLRDRDGRTARDLCRSGRARQADVRGHDETEALLARATV